MSFARSTSLGFEIEHEEIESLSDAATILRRWLRTISEVFGEHQWRNRPTATAVGIEGIEALASSAVAPYYWYLIAGDPPRHLEVMVSVGSASPSTGLFTRLRGGVDLKTTVTDLASEPGYLEGLYAQLRADPGTQQLSLSPTPIFMLSQQAASHTFPRAPSIGWREFFRVARPLDVKLQLPEWVQLIRGTDFIEVLLGENPLSLQPSDVCLVRDELLDVGLLQSVSRYQ